MNQILTTNNDNNYNQNDTKKIIIIFSIAIILIACIIIAVALVFKKQDTGELITPEIEIVRQEEKEITIKVACSDGIDYVVYTWNDEKNNKVNLNNSTSFERIISMPENKKNTLNVEAVSSKGAKGIKQEQYELNIDTDKPVIDDMTVTESVLHIEASDDNGIDYLVYQWEDEEENKIRANEEDNKKISADVNIKRGTYKLTVKVFDISGNKEEVSKLITGVNQPEIDAIKLGDIVKITVKHDMGFKKIEYQVNDKLYVYDENYSGYDKEKTTMELEIPLKEGENLIRVKAYSLEKLTNDETEEDDIESYSSKTFLGKCTYTP